MVGRPEEAGAAVRCRGTIHRTAEAAAGTRAAAASTDQGSRHRLVEGLFGAHTSPDEVVDAEADEDALAEELIAVEPIRPRVTEQRIATEPIRLTLITGLDRKRYVPKRRPKPPPRPAE